MGFWAKRIIIMCLVIAGAVAAIIFVPGKPSLDEDGKVVERASIQSNMAKFYEEFSLVSSDKIDEKYGDFVIPLPQAKQGLMEQVNNQPAPRMQQDKDFNFRGDYKSRAFARDSTLMTGASSYVAAEGMSLIWHLNQDFIVKQRFISKNTLTGMLNDIAGAIDSNFVAQVEVFYCEDKRVLVITDEQDPAFTESCRSVD